MVNNSEKEIERQEDSAPSWFKDWAYFGPEPHRRTKRKSFVIKIILLAFLCALFFLLGSHIGKSNVHLYVKDMETDKISEYDCRPYHEVIQKRVLLSAGDSNKIYLNLVEGDVFFDSDENGSTQWSVYCQ